MKEWKEGKNVSSDDLFLDTSLLIMLPFLQHRHLVYHAMPQASPFLACSAPEMKSLAPSSLLFHSNPL